MNTLEDRRFCIYAHYDKSGNLFYIGQGTIKRSRSLSITHHSKNKDWKKIVKAEKSEIKVVVLMQHLTKEEAQDIESKMIKELKNKVPTLTNKSCGYVQEDYTKEDYENSVVYAESSPSGLVWKHTSAYKNGKVKRKAGDTAGLLNKHTGYWVISVKSGYRFCHRVVFCLVNGVTPKNLVINHKDSNKGNNKIANLEAVSHRENTLHGMLKGGIKVLRGDNAPWSLVSDSEVIQMYDKMFQGLNNVEIGLLYKLKPTTVSAIRHGVSRKHLFDKLPHPPPALLVMPKRKPP